jgi:glycosyltransferase involved in cell wall biosynthesis
LSEQASYRAIIPIVSERTFRPLWSVMIPTYNCANYLRETLASVLKQDPGPEIMQIEVVDDYSTQDDPEAVVEELGRGRVNFYRQPENIGHIRNFNTCLQRAHGNLIHLLHGDDCVRDGFYRKLQWGFENSPEVGAAFCRPAHMDALGNLNWIYRLEHSESCTLKNWLERISLQNLIQPPSMVVRRAVYEKIGGFDSRICCFAEDWEMWVRIAAHYPIWYEVEPLALYRVHSSSLTGRGARTGQNVRDLRQVINIIQPYLPKATSSELSKKARENCAIFAINEIMPQMFAIGDLAAATIQIQEALKCSYSLKVIQELIYILWRTGQVSIKAQARKMLRLIKDTSII